MAKPTANITVELDPEVMELLRGLVARVEALEREVERLRKGQP